MNLEKIIAAPYHVLSTERACPDLKQIGNTVKVSSRVAGASIKLQKADRVSTHTKAELNVTAAYLNVIQHMPQTQHGMGYQ